MTDIEQLEQNLGYQFRDSELLQRALTHRSYAYERNHCMHNESLEFLGDAVLGLIISQWLVEKYPTYPEGTLAKFKSYLVCSQHLAEQARLLNLGNFLRLNRGEEKTGGRQKRALLENTFEALIAAIYLDGGLEMANQFIRQRFEASVAELDPLNVSRADSKTALQDWLRSQRMPLPEYFTVSSDGPPHKPEFCVGLKISGDVIAYGKGPSLKSAHQVAARQALRCLQQQAANQETSEPTE